jgi:uncharacterized membrane protein YbhN (UPF0104 family)
MSRDRQDAASDEVEQPPAPSWGRIAARIATGLVVLLFAFYAINNREALSGLLAVSWTTLVLVAVGRLLIFFSNGMFIKWTAEAFTRRLSMGEGIYVGILSAVGNFFGPLLGGASIRAVYLRRVHNLPYTKFTSTLMVYYVILFAINFALALIGLLALGEAPPLLIAVFGGGLLLLFASVSVRLPQRIRSDNPRRSGLTARIVRYLIDIEEGWRRMLAMPQLLVKLVGLAAISIAGQLLIAVVSFSSIGADIAWSALAVYVAIVTISLLVSVTPGALGVREAMLLLVSETLRVTDNEIIQVAVIDRGVTFALLFGLFLTTRSSRLRVRLSAGEGPD